MLDCIKLDLQLEDYKKAGEMMRMILESPVALSDPSLYVTISKQLCQVSSE